MVLVPIRKRKEHPLKTNTCNYISNSEIGLKSYQKTMINDPFLILSPEILQQLATNKVKGKMKKILKDIRAAGRKTSIDLGVILLTGQLTGRTRCFQDRATFWSRFKFKSTSL